MSFEERGKRDGTGPYKDSFRKIEEKDVGRRIEAGEKCPKIEGIKIPKIKWK